MPNKSPQNPLLLSADQAAAFLGIGRSHLYSLHSSGRLPLPVKLGRRTLWRRDELSAWVAAGCPSRDKWINIREMMMKPKRKTIFPVVVLIVKLTIRLIKVLL